MLVKTVTSVRTSQRHTSSLVNGPVARHKRRSRRLKVQSTTEEPILIYLSGSAIMPRLQANSHSRSQGHAQQMMHMMIQKYSIIGALSKLCEEYAQCDDEGESILVDLGKLSINKLGGATPLHEHLRGVRVLPSGITRRWSTACCEA